MNAATTVERVLQEGAMSSTYKLAVLRALVDITIEQPSQEPVNGFHFVPLIDLARRVLAYYWRPAVERVQQGSQPTTIVRQINDLRANPSGRMDLPNALTTGAILHDRILEAPRLPPELLSALRAIRRTLIEQPLRHIHNLPSGRAHLFSLLASGAPGDPPLPLEAGYEVHLQAARQTGRLGSVDNWPGLVSVEHAHLVLSARTYEELAELRFWLKDAVLYRWVRACERFNGSATLPANLLELERPGRDPTLIGRIRSIYGSVPGLQSLYSDVQLVGPWEVDHLLPFSRYPVELFWNLVPATPAENHSKGDRLPLLTMELRNRYEQFFDRVIRTDNAIVSADVEATYRRYFQRVVDFRVLPKDEVVRSLWTVVEQSWAHLDRAGAPIWSH